MNPDRIYSLYRDDALVYQLEQQSYQTFVAMPFKEQENYHSAEILDTIIKPAAELASKKARGGLRRSFAEPFRVDEGPHVAKSITDEIVKSILEYHLFIADLTTMNSGVLLELGIALGMKPNGHIICISQGSPKELHFDIKDIDVIAYNVRDKEDGICKIAQAFVAAAKYFEKVEDRYIRRLIATMSPDELMFLGLYAELQKNHKGAGTGPALNNRAIKQYEQDDDETGNYHDLFQRSLHALPALAMKRLMWMHIEKGARDYGIHATKLGWHLIKFQFPEFRNVPERALPK